MKPNYVRKYLYLFLGSVSLVLGIIGVFAPVLPTTPFLLLASYCYLQSSERMYNWLIKHKIFGAYIYSYMTYRAVPRKTKIGAVIFLWSTLILSMIFVPSLLMRIFLFAVGIAVTVHLMTLKTLRDEELKTLKDLYSSKLKEQELHEKQ